MHVTQPLKDRPKNIQKKPPFAFANGGFFVQGSRFKVQGSLVGTNINHEEDDKI